MKKYEVVSSRHDIAPRVADAKSFESDAEAQRWFDQEFVGSERWAWDFLVLREVVQERIERTVDTSRPEDREDRK